MNPDMRQALVVATIAFGLAACSSRQNDAVLVAMNQGTAAYRAGDRAAAAQAFDAALGGIEEVYADNDEARAARSLFAEESEKPFKGEPWERAMAYYYRGLLFLGEGDYANARASFRGGQLQDSLAEQEEFRADFALLDFLDGWSSQCNGDAPLAADAYRDVSALRPGWVAPPAQHDYLLVVESGSAPIKIATGEHEEALQVRPGEPLEELAALHVGDAAIEPALSENIFVQASTRGGREFDVILEGKAQYKENTEQVARSFGDVSLITMQVANQQLVQATTLAAANPALAQSLQAAGTYGMAAAAGLALISLGSSAASSAMRTEADTRYWASLPNAVQVVTLSREDVAGRAITASFRDGGGQVHTVEMNADAAIGDACRILWIRSEAGSLTASAAGEP